MVAEPARQMATFEADCLGDQGPSPPSLALSPKSSICKSSLRRVPGRGSHLPGCQHPQVLSAAKKKEAEGPPR